MFVRLSQFHIMFTTTKASHSSSPKLLIKLLTREGPIESLAVFIEHTVSRGFPRFPKNFNHRKTLEMSFLTFSQDSMS